MTREEREDAIDIIQSILDKYEEDECLVTDIGIGDEDIEVFRMAIKALEQEPILDKLDEIITDALDKSTDQKESQTLRWVLDKISEVM